MRQPFALFETALGTCAMRWGTAGIDRIWLPEASPLRLQQRLRGDGNAEEAAPDAETAGAIDAMVRLLGGEPVDLTAVRVDHAALPAFDRAVLVATRAIPPGRFITYGELAARLPSELVATPREVGRALGANPTPIVVPCHRVVAAAGKLGGFSAPGGAATKARLLAIEGAHALDRADLFDVAALP